MAERANVRSIDSISDCRASLIKYIPEARVALGEARSDVLRTQQWIDAKKIEWKNRQKKCNQLFANARSDLERAKIARPDAHSTMFTDQIRAIEKVRRKLDECEHKLKMNARWSRELERESMLFQGGLQRLSRIIDGDLEKGVAWMATLLDHLNNYVQTKAPKLPRAEAADLDSAPPRRQGGGRIEHTPEGAQNEPDLQQRKDTATDQGSDDAMGAHE